jgi:hypothetical protein
MTMVTEVESDGGRAVVVKRGSAAEAEALRLEGERLRRASHPGVVPVVASGPVGAGWELRTVHGGRPVSILGHPTVVQTAAVIAAAASTLADLHDLGIVHGRVDSSHVLLGEHGRPVLCGFGPGTESARPSDDVAALGALLSHLLGADSELEPIPDRRWRSRRSGSGWDRRALLLLADHACAEPATRRPTARRLATAITDAIPEVARVASPASPWPERSETDEVDPIERLRSSSVVDDPPPPRRPIALVSTVLGLGLLAAAAMRSGGGAAPDEAVPLADVAPTVSTLDTSTTLTTEPVIVHTAAPVPDSILAIDGRRYRVGQAGDEVLVDDWDCDGIPTPALLRPGTDEVYVFPRWADQVALSIQPLLVVPEAESLVSEPSPSGCPSLAVRTAGGGLVPVIETPAP